MGRENAQKTRWREWASARHRGALILLFGAVAASAVLLFHYDHQLTFVADDWELLVVRDGWGAPYFLDPYHEHILIGPAVVYKSLLTIFGMGSALPFYAAAISAFLGSAVLLFVYLRRRVGDWLALVLTVLVLFLGAAFEDFFFAFQIGYFGSVLAGLGVLLMLDREDERGDWIACVLLVVSIAFSSVGLVFLVGAVVDVALGRRPRARRAYMVAWPVLLFAIWWFGWGHQAESNISLDNILHAPEFAFEAAASGVTSLLGLATGDGSEPDQPHLIWGKILLVIGAIFLAVRLHREGRVPKGLAVVLAIGLSFWLLAGVNREDERFPTSSRYQYPSAVFLLLIIGEGLRGLRIPRLSIVATAVVGGLAIWGGIGLMDREFSERWKPVADSTRSSLAAIDLAAPSIDPAFPVDFPPTITVPARRYLAAVRDYGSPAFGEGELSRRPEAERAAADLTMAQALGLSLESGRLKALRCETLSASTSGETGVTLPPDAFMLTNEAGTPVEVLLGRFADLLSVGLGPLGPGVRTTLLIPPDASDRAWRLGLRGSGSVRLCTGR